MRQPIPATLIPGDGIGPEIVDATLAALEALGTPFQWDTHIAGLEGVKTQHLLDATACLWTARRIKARAVNRLPEDPEWDEQSLLMQILR